MPMPLENFDNVSSRMSQSYYHCNTILFKLTSNVNAQPRDLGGDSITYTLVTRTLNLVTHQPESLCTIGRHYKTSVAMATL